MSGQSTVLVVEDEWPARNYLVELLEGSGLAEVVGAVGTAGDADTAGALAQIRWRRSLLARAAILSRLATTSAHLTTSAEAQAVETNWETDSPDARILPLRAAMSC